MTKLNRRILLRLYVISSCITIVCLLKVKYAVKDLTRTMEVARESFATVDHIIDSVHCSFQPMFDSAQNKDWVFRDSVIEEYKLAVTNTLKERGHLQ